MVRVIVVAAVLSLAGLGCKRKDLEEPGVSDANACAVSQINTAKVTMAPPTPVKVDDLKAKMESSALYGFEPKPMSGDGPQVEQKVLYMSFTQTVGGIDGDYAWYRVETGSDTVEGRAFAVGAEANGVNVFYDWVPLTVVDARPLIKISFRQCAADARLVASTDNLKNPLTLDQTCGKVETRTINTLTTIVKTTFATQAEIKGHFENRHGASNEIFRILRQDMVPHLAVADLSTGADAEAWKVIRNNVVNHPMVIANGLIGGQYQTLVDEVGQLQAGSQSLELASSNKIKRCPSTKDLADIKQRLHETSLGLSSLSDSFDSPMVGGSSLSSNLGGDDYGFGDFGRSSSADIDNGALPLQAIALQVVGGDEGCLTAEALEEGAVITAKGCASPFSNNQKFQLVSRSGSAVIKLEGSNLCFASVGKGLVLKDCARGAAVGVNNFGIKASGDVLTQFAFRLDGGCVSATVNGRQAEVRTCDFGVEQRFNARFGSGVGPDRRLVRWNWWTEFAENARFYGTVFLVLPIVVGGTWVGMYNQGLTRAWGVYDQARATNMVGEITTPKYSGFKFRVRPNLDPKAADAVKIQWEGSQKKINSAIKYGSIASLVFAVTILYAQGEFGPDGDIFKDGLFLTNSDNTNGALDIASNLAAQAARFAEAEAEITTNTK